MAGTIEINGTGGIIEGNLGAANVNVNLDAPYIFDGSNDMFTVADHNDFDLSATLTLSAWIKPTGTGATWQMIATKNGLGGDADRPYAMWYRSSDNRIYLYLGDDSGSSALGTDSNAVVANAWNHVAVTFDNSSNTGKIYVNGVLVKTGTSLTTSPYNSTKSFSIGAINDNDGGTASDMFVGNIVDLKVFSDVLTDAEVQEISSKINYDISVGSIGNLVAWYKLMGAVADSSGNSHNLTAVGSPAQDYDAYSVDVYDNSTTTDGTFTVTQGKVEGLALTSLDFDGSDDRVDIGELGDYTAISMAVWVKPDDASPINQGIIGSEGNKNGIATGAGSNTLRIKHESVNSSFTDTTYTWVQNQWQQVGFSWDGSTLNVYAGGVQINSVSLSGSPWGMTNADIGVLVDGIWPFDGEIRDVRLYDYGLSEEQMASLYSNTYPQTPKHWYKLDDGSGTTAEDFGTIMKRMTWEY